MAYVQGKSALQRGAIVPGPGIKNRSVIISADAKDMLSLGVVSTSSDEFQEWLKHEKTQTGDLNLTVQINNTNVKGTPTVPECDPGPYLVSGNMGAGRKSSTSTFYRPSQIDEIFKFMESVSVEKNVTNGKTYWYGVLDGVDLIRATQDKVNGYVIRPGTVKAQPYRGNSILNIGLRQYNITNACKEWCINNRNVALQRRPDLVNAKFMQAGMTASEIANEKDDVTKANDVENTQSAGFDDDVLPFV